MNIWKKIGLIAVAAVIGAGGVVGAVNVAGASTNAVACKWGSYPLCPRSVAEKQVVDNSLPAGKILKKDRDAFLKDTNPLGGAYYSVAYYDKGDTNAGAIATAACDKTTDTAISGGVQTVGLDADANARNTPVSSSFAGRMDWATNTPKAGRLDGWIVQFGGNAGAVSDKAPEKVKIWALCVPGLDVPVKQTYLQSAG